MVTLNKGTTNQAWHEALSAAMRLEFISFSFPQDDWSLNSVHHGFTVLQPIHTSV